MSYTAYKGLNTKFSTAQVLKLPYHYKIIHFINILDYKTKGRVVKLKTKTQTSNFKLTISYSKLSTFL